MFFVTSMVPGTAGYLTLIKLNFSLDSFKKSFKADPLPLKPNEIAR
jgi:hypothetical protein